MRGILNVVAVIFQFYIINNRESFGQFRYLESLEGRFEANFRNKGFALPGIITGKCILEGCLEIIAFDGIVSLLGKDNVFLSFGPGRVGIVYYKWHLGAKAGMQENVLTVPGIQQVQGYSDM